jgi:hypothetical protein
MKKLPGIMNFTLGVFIITSTSLFFLLFWLFYATMPFHDFYLSHMDRALQSIAPPVGSKKLEQYVFFGSRYTDTSECTYAVGQMYSAPLSREEITQAYKNVSTEIFGPVHVEIVEKGTSLPLDNPADAWITEFLSKKSSNTSDAYYLVYLYKPGQSWLGDMRCYD